MPTLPPQKYTRDYYLRYPSLREAYSEGLVRPVHQAALELLSPKPESVILDAGCGGGGMVRVLASSGCYAVGIDYSSDAVKLAKDLGNAPIIRGSVTHLPFRNEVFDGITFLYVYEHLDHADQQRCLKELYRVLKKDGKIVAFMPNIRFPVTIIARIFRRVQSIGPIKWHGDLHPGEESTEAICRRFSAKGFSVTNTTLLKSSPFLPLKGKPWSNNLWPLLENMGVFLFHFFPHFYSDLRLIARKE